MQDLTFRAAQLPSCLLLALRNLHLDGFRMASWFSKGWLVWVGGLKHWLMLMKWYISGIFAAFQKILYRTNVSW